MAKTVSKRERKIIEAIKRGNIGFQPGPQKPIPPPYAGPKSREPQTPPWWQRQ